MMLSSFDPQFYNSLLSISDADSAFFDREKLFSKLALLFSREEYNEICLVHRHFDLKSGERMVSHGLVSFPTSSPIHDGPNIIPERWTAYGRRSNSARLIHSTKLSRHQHCSLKSSGSALANMHQSSVFVSPKAASRRPSLLGND
jgi:hypothetical protein